MAKFKLEFEMTDGSKKDLTFEVPDGKDGVKGDTGDTGAKGDTGVGIVDVTIETILEA